VLVLARVRARVPVEHVRVEAPLEVADALADVEVRARRPVVLADAEERVERRQVRHAEVEERVRVVGAPVLEVLREEVEVEEVARVPFAGVFVSEAPPPRGLAQSAVARAVIRRVVRISTRDREA
jgi:sulfur carrier protein ThiS